MFKSYHRDQVELLPPSFEELIPSGHLVRLISRVIDQMNIDKILATYKGVGTSNFHPRMMLKVIVYGYTQEIYTNRKIAKAIREQTPFMRLFGGNRPDFRTIAHFREAAFIDKTLKKSVKVLKKRYFLVNGITKDSGRY